MSLKLPSNATEAQELAFVNHILAKQVRNKINEFNKQSKFIKIGDFYFTLGESKPTEYVRRWQFWKRK